MAYVLTVSAGCIIGARKMTMTDGVCTHCLCCGYNIILSSVQERWPWLMASLLHRVYYQSKKDYHGWWRVYSLFLQCTQQCICLNLYLLLQLAVGDPPCPQRPTSCRSHRTCPAVVSRLTDGKGEAQAGKQEHNGHLGKHLDVLTTNICTL